MESAVGSELDELIKSKVKNGQVAVKIINVCQKL
jgi:hypothetical protein